MKINNTNCMNILFVTNGYPTEKHPEYCVFTKEQINSVLKNENIQGDVHFVNVREKGIGEYYRSYRVLRKVARNYDLVHCFHGFTLLLVFLASPRQRILISFLNSIENEFSEKKLLSMLFVRIMKVLIKRRNIWAIFKDSVPRYIHERSYYLPNGVDMDRFKPMDKIKAKELLGLDINKRYALFVSSKNKYRPQKNYNKYLKIMELLREKHGIEDVEEISIIDEPRERVSLFFNAADLHILCSDFEGSPNSIKEALACNTPVVSTPVGNVADMLSGIEGSYVSSSFSEDELSELAKNVLCCNKSYDFRERIKMKGLDIETTARKLMGIYECIIKE